MDTRISYISHQNIAHMIMMIKYIWINFFFKCIFKFVLLNSVFDVDWLQILPTLKPAISEVLQSYFRHSSLSSSDKQKDVMATIMAAVVAEMTNSIKQVCD